MSSYDITSFFGYANTVTGIIHPGTNLLLQPGEIITDNLGNEFVFDYGWQGRVRAYPKGKPELARDYKARQFNLTFN